VTYTKQNWVDGQTGGTPLSADRLNYLEEGLRVAAADATAAAALVPGAGTDLTALINSFVAPFNSSQPYREPTTTEKNNGVAGIQRLAISGADSAGLLTPLGFTISSGIDSVTKKPYILAYNEFGTDRSWGLYLVDLSAPIRLIIECPHPVSDQYSELMGLQHWQAVSGTLLMLAGAHRDAAAALADVAHQTGSLFHGVAASFADMKLPQIQHHGFADATAPGLTQVVSAGTGIVGSAIRRVSQELTSAGFTVGNAWDSSGSGTSLTATTNVQGIDAAAKNTTWIHVENNATTRNSVDSRRLAVASVIAAQTEGLAYADGAVPLANAVTGQFPNNVGTANTAGTSAFASRSDHIHKERQATLDRITTAETNITTLQAYATVIGGEYRASAQQSLAVGANKMQFGTTIQAATGITWNGTDAFTVVTAGRYAFGAFAKIPVVANNSASISIVSGTTYPSTGTGQLTGEDFSYSTTDISCSATRFLAAGTSITCWIYNNSASTNTAFSARPAEFFCWRVG
jgi:hypothetical protein